MRHFDIPLKTYTAAVDQYKRLSARQRLAIFSTSFLLFLSIAGTVHYLQVRAFSGGTGTISDPYLISTCVELQDIGSTETNLRASYLLTADISCAGIANFTPIGSQTLRYDQYGPIFSGRFDGGGHIISNLSLAYPANLFVGLFAQTDGAVIRNVSIQNANVTGGGYVGGLVASALRTSLIGITIASSTIITTASTGSFVAAGSVAGFVGNGSGLYELSITNSQVSNQSPVDDSTPRYAGGAVGYLSGSVLGNSFSSATTTSTTWPVGGMVGGADAATIINTYSTGRLTGTTDIGGIIGRTDSSGATIKNSYFNGIATTSQWATPANIGGILGADESNFFTYPGSSLINNFAVGVVSSTTHAGGILGGITHISTPAGAVYSNNYFYPTGTTRSTCSGQGTSFSAGECTSDNVSSHYNSNTFAPESSWDFVHMWQNVASNRPSLRLLPYTAPSSAPSSATSIGSCAALVSAILTNPDGWYALSSDIDCAGDPTLIPISYFRRDAYFTGTLDGNGHVISGVNISTTTTTNNIGLFGTLVGAYIKNVFLTGSGVTARYSNNVGALAGSATASTINAVTSSVPVSGGAYSVGGLVGLEAHYIGSSHASANVSGSYNGTANDGDTVGGLIGRSQERLVIENSSYTTGTVTAISRTGGLAGFLRGDIRTSSSSATIVGDSQFGGLVGLIGDNFSTSTITSSSFSGVVTGIDPISTYHVAGGGIAGDANNTTFTDVLSSGTLTFPASLGLSGIGGIVGYMSSQSPFTSNIRDSSFTGTISSVTSVSATSGYYNIGGIMGNGSPTGEVTNTVSSSTITLGSPGVPTSNGAGSIGGFFGNVNITFVATSSSRGSIKIYGTSGTAYIPEIGGFAGAVGAYKFANVHSSTTIDITGNQVYGVGGLVGDTGGYISNSDSSGYITITAANQSYIGGLVGDYYGSVSETYIVSKVYATGAITLTGGQDGTSQISQVGGLLGEAFRPIDIHDVYASSTVTITSSVTSGIGGHQIGGLIGYIYGGVIITNGYSSGAVSFNSVTGATSDFVGGAFGQVNNAGGANTFSNLFTASPVSAGPGALKVGAFIGSYGLTDVFTNIAYDIFRTNQPLCTGLDVTDPAWCTAQNAANATPTYFYSHLNTPQSSWDFANVWLEHTNTYPTFGMSIFSSTPPTVTTSGSVTGITSTSALTTGNLIDTGTSAVIEEGFVYGPSISYVATSSAVSGSFPTGPFSATLGGLTPNTIYHFASYARSSVGTSYGFDQTFTTSPAVVAPQARSGSVVHNSITPPLPVILEQAPPTIVIPDTPPSNPPITTVTKTKPASTAFTQRPQTTIIAEVAPVAQNKPLPIVTSPPPPSPPVVADIEKPGLLERAVQGLLALKDIIASSGSPFQSWLMILIALNVAVVLIRFGYILLSGIRTISDIPFLVLRNLSTFFTLGFLRRRKGETWGTVYDSKTLRPLDPAVVTLFDESGKELKTQITDLDGRFGFFVQPGIYSLTAQKGHHTFPAHADPALDPLYQEHYYGAPIVMEEAGTLIKDIPLDPTDFDWNEQEKYRHNLYRFYSRLDRPLAYASTMLTIAGAIAAVVSVVIDPEPLNYFLLAIYTIVGLYFLIVGAPRLYGKVKYATQFMPFALVRARLPGNTSGGPHTVSDHLGRYYLLLPPGDTFIVSVEEKKPDTSYNTVWQGNMHPKRGYLNKDITVL